ncbi:Sec-independent protein translocase protein TatA [Actinopolymorpha pittospori]|uniref:Sec-independent protein translocase protein TatA n=1 Tax=Actinopolymorpha pittospori TaxID=648752 RepID=A0A927R6C0_9ACTN|nr:Sec-independent protein translocase protein TatA [Actinopolymorpha pittospori]
MFSLGPIELLIIGVVVVAVVGVGAWLIVRALMRSGRRT